MQKQTVLLLLVAMMISPLFAQAEEKAKKAKVEMEIELDAYYSNIGWYIPLLDQPIPHIDNLSELDVYKTLIKESLRPDFLVVEGSVNPLPYFGTYLKSNHSSFFEPNKNYIQPIVKGFDEPYALSLFAGRVFRFDGAMDEQRAANKGYIGVLVSTGNHHIKDSVIIKDRWVEVEWKAKGDRETGGQALSWGVFVGGKFHHNPEIADVVTFGIRRSKVDFIPGVQRFLENIGFEYRFDLLQANLHPSRHFLLMKKFVPINGTELALSLDFGLLWEGAKRYSGSLATGLKSGWTFIFRPNIKF